MDALALKLRSARPRTSLNDSHATPSWYRPKYQEDDHTSVSDEDSITAWSQVPVPLVPAVAARPKAEVILEPTKVIAKPDGQFSHQPCHIPLETLSKLLPDLEGVRVASCGGLNVGKSTFANAALQLPGLFKVGSTRTTEGIELAVCNVPGRTGHPVCVSWLDVEGMDDRSAHRDERYTAETFAVNSLFFVALSAGCILFHIRMSELDTHQGSCTVFLKALFEAIVHIRRAKLPIRFPQLTLVYVVRDWIEAKKNTSTIGRIKESVESSARSELESYWADKNGMDPATFEQLDPVEREREFRPLWTHIRLKFMYVKNHDEHQEEFESSVPYQFLDMLGDLPRSSMSKQAREIGETWRQAQVLAGGVESMNTDHIRWTATVTQAALLCLMEYESQLSHTVRSAENEAVTPLWNLNDFVLKRIKQRWIEYFRSTWPGQYRAKPELAEKHWEEANLGLKASIERYRLEDFQRQEDQRLGVELVTIVTNLDSHRSPNFNQVTNQYKDLWIKRLGARHIVPPEEVRNYFNQDMFNDVCKAASKVYDNQRELVETTVREAGDKVVKALQGRIAEFANGAAPRVNNGLFKKEQAAKMTGARSVAFDYDVKESKERTKQLDDLYKLYEEQFAYFREEEKRKDLAEYQERKAAFRLGEQGKMLDEARKAGEKFGEQTKVRGPPAVLTGGVAAGTLLLLATGPVGVVIGGTGCALAVWGSVPSGTAKFSTWWQRRSIRQRADAEAEKKVPKPESVFS